MTPESESAWHRNAEVTAEDTPLRLGKPFQKALVWAQDYGFDEEVELVYHTLQMGDDLVALGNFIQEFSHPESIDLLKSWSTHLVCSRLTVLAGALLANPQLCSAYVPFRPVNNVRLQFGKLVERTFLLSMITNPLPATDDKRKYRWRRLLRLWVFIQAANRVASGECYADKNISTVARHLIIRPSYDDKRWRCIDSLQQSVTQKLGGSSFEFELFSRALGLSANQQIIHSDDKADRTFLRALALIAEGVATPICSQSGSAVAPIPMRLFRNAHIDFNSTSAFNEAADETEDQDETVEITHVEVDPSDSYAQQQLSAKSVLLHTAEMSHYLPWSWEKPHPHEQESLNQWVLQHLSATGPVSRLGAALVWIALNIGRSLARIEAIKISDTPDQEWRIDSTLTQISRLTPQRKNPWPPTKTDELWVNNYTNSFSIRLPSNVADALSIANPLESNHQTLSSVWRNAAKIPLEQWFNQQMTGSLSRVTSGMLANSQPQAVFDRSADPTLARLLASHPQSALPGACAYGAWDSDTVTEALQTPVFTSDAALPSDGKTVNIAGSRLDPLETLLIESIAEATSRLDVYRDQNPIDFHNRFVGYCVMALYAATGCRPIRDPFESPLHFNFEHGLVYINDKSDGGLHNGRLVPLPAAMIDLIQKKYFQHLRLLAQSMGKHHPAMAASIRDLSNHQAAQTLPLFFFLDSELNWYSVSNKTLSDLDLFRWPLPPNLFRHRYSQQLSRAGVDVEVVDGWMGHAESGVATYGDFSVRCWINDAEQSRSLINRLYDRLAFDIVDTWHSAPHLLPPVHIPTNLKQMPESFGIRAREYNRRKTVRNAIHDARKDIALFLNGQLLSELTPDKLDMLVRIMVVGSSGMPKPHAHLRYQLLIKQIERIYKQQQIKLTLKRHFSASRQEKTYIDQSAPIALSALPKLLQLVDKTLRKVLPSRLNQADSLLIGAVLLCLEKRISYPKLLSDVLQNQHWRILKVQGHFYLEYSEQLERDDYLAAVQRHHISPKLAALLDRGALNNRVIDIQKGNCPEILSELLVMIGYPRESHTTIRPLAVIDRLCKIVGQANLVELPGILAATLSDRVLSSSLSLRDWVRLTTGKRILLPQESEEATGNDDQLRSLISETLLKFRKRPQAGLARESLQSNTERYFSAIKQELKTYTKPQARQCAARVNQVSKIWEGQVCGAALLLGQWIEYRIRRGKKGPDKWLAPSSVDTYFATLATPFEALAYEHDLISMESDEITDLYAAMVDLKKLTGKSANYFGKRLIEFHRWASAKGVATVDWAEIDLPEAGRTVSPGMLTESEYQDALLLIMNRLDLTDQDFPLFLAFALLACYRFGLRSTEATGLMRADWCRFSTSWVVVVRNNRIRELKSRPSKRLVPLLFPLSEIERQIIEQMLGRYAAVAGKNKKASLFCAGRGAKLAPNVPLIAPTLIQILRHVTGNPQCVLHHCRHAFHNRVTVALYDIPTPLAKAVSMGGYDPEDLRRLALGQQHAVSRRSTMGAARLMGHAHPRTGIINYNHLLSDWADCFSLQPKSSRLNLKTALNVAQLQQQGSLSTELLQGKLPAYRAATPSMLLKVMRLTSQGKSFKQACRKLWINPSFAPRIETVIRRATQHMWFSQKAHQTQRIAGKDQPIELLQRVTEDGWNRLITQADRFNRGFIKIPPANERPSSDKLPYMLGETRQLLMRRPKQFQLAKLVIDGFVIPDTLFKVVSRSGHNKYEGMANNQGFNVLSAQQAGAHDKPQQLDHYRDKSADDESYHRRYCALVLTRNSSEIIRSSFDLAVATLALGLADPSDL